MALVQHPLFWFDIRGAHGNRWDFFLTNQRISPVLRSKIKKNKKLGDWGVTVYAERRVYINGAYPPDDIWSTTLHELMHCALEVSGMDRKLEESFVMHAEDGMASFLSQLGLELPALPYGAEKLRVRR